MVNARPTLLLPFRNRAAFLDQYFDRGALGGLFVPGEVDVALGEEVDVEVSFAEEQVRFHIRGQVRWKRTAARRSILPGVGIEFLETEARTHDLLLAFARGEDVHHKERAARRYGVQTEVRIKADGRTSTVLTDDLSEGGAFLLMDDPLPIGAHLELRLKPPGALFGIGLDALVAWRRVEAGRTGVGVEFVFEPGARKREKVARLVRLLKERLVRELRVKAPRLPGSSLPPTQARNDAAPE